MRTIRDAQGCIGAWVTTAFGERIARDAGERVLRFVEEAVELAQACDTDPAVLHRLVDYVYWRPKGTHVQEVAGSMVTLLAIANALDVDAESAFEVEQARIHQPEIIEKVRARQKEKRESLVAVPLAIKGEKEDGG